VKNNILNFYEEKFLKSSFGQNFSSVEIIDSSFSLDQIYSKCPVFFKGWYELVKLKPYDAIDFVKEFWENTLPYSASFEYFLNYFFSFVDLIVPVLLKQKNSQNYVAELCYFFRDKNLVYRGSLPISDDNKIFQINSSFENVFPEDFLSFLKIHNGFAKFLDFGIMDAYEIPFYQKQIVQNLQSNSNVIKCNDVVVDPSMLIPFYRSANSRDFQCFYKDWYPNLEIGNVNFSISNHTISNYMSSIGEDSLAFQSFLDWFKFYLEEIEE
jgi:hypothetical protein